MSSASERGHGGGHAPPGGDDEEQRHLSDLGRRRCRSRMTNWDGLRTCMPDSPPPGCHDAEAGSSLAAACGTTAARGTLLRALPHATAESEDSNASYSSPESDSTDDGDELARIEWLRDEVAQQRRPAPDQPLAPSPSPAPPAKRKAEGVKAEADASDKRSWMSSAQLWTCGGHSSTGTSNGGSDRRQPQKVSTAFMPLNGLPTSAKSSDRPEAAAMAVPDLSLSSPAINASCPAAPSANSSAVTDAGEQQSAQRKARRYWSPELHRRFIAALQRLGGPHTATPKQIRDMMKVDGLTNDEVKSHRQKYSLHTRRASNSDQQKQCAGLWPPPEQYTTSQHSTSQQSSGLPQAPLQLTTGSSRAVSVTAADSCEGDEEEDGRSASYGWEMQQKASSSS